MPSGHVYAEDQYLGAFSYANHPADSWGWQSLAYFCPECGEVWARVVMARKNGETQQFRPVIMGCRRHFEPWGIPGSLLRGELQYNLDELSVECLARELDVHLSYYERML